MPDASLKLHELSDSHSAVLFETDFLVNEATIKTATFSTQDLTHVYSISDGGGLMKAMTQLVEWKQNQAVQIDCTNSYRATFRWDGDDLVLERKTPSQVAYLPLKIQVMLAQEMGWLVQYAQKK